MAYEDDIRDEIARLAAEAAAALGLKGEQVVTYGVDDGPEGSLTINV